MFLEQCLRPYVFPAPAGMNRRMRVKIAVESRVPRASGDEPPREVLYWRLYSCSPRQRG